MERIKFRIDGFHCEACVKLATMKIKKIHGVESVSVQSDGITEIISGRKIALDEIKEAFNGTGYEIIVLQQD